MIKANPPKKAIKTSRISGLVLANNSDDSSRSGNNQKNKKAVKTLNRIITPKLMSDFFSVSISLMAIDKPIPKIGPMRGEINIAPMTTAVELALRPMEATNIEHIRIQAVAPLKGISLMIASMVLSRSVSPRKSSNSIINTFTLDQRPMAAELISEEFVVVSELELLGDSIFCY